MIRGTTPTLTFRLPFSSALLAEAWVTVEQRGRVVIDKQLCDCQIGENEITLTLTQEETLQLECTCKTKIQLRVRTQSGDALASEIFDVPTGAILKDGVI